MLQNSGFLAQMCALCLALGFHHVVYGDAAYPLGPYLLKGVKRNDNRLDLVAWSKRMNKDRTSVEWGIGKVTTYFSHLTDKKQFKLGLRRIGPLFNVATILTNCHTCCCGSVTGQWFGANHPILEAYLDLNTQTLAPLVDWTLHPEAPTP